MSDETDPTDETNDYGFGKHYPNFDTPKPRMHPSVELDLVIKERDQLKQTIAAKDRELAEMESVIVILRTALESGQEIVFEGTPHQAIPIDAYIAVEESKKPSTALSQLLAPVIEDLERESDILSEDDIGHRLLRSALAQLKEIVGEK